MKIYTKTGDSGETSLFGGKRVSKAELRLESYGTIDELNSSLGLVRAFLHTLRNQANLEPFATELNGVLEGIQIQLFTLGSHLACVDPKLQAKLPAPHPDAVEILERKMDQYTATLPELKNFILPGGGVVAAQFHLARTVCRRAERSVIRLHEEKEKIPEFAVIYLNRLSDFLFVAARYANHQQGLSDILWKA